MHNKFWIRSNRYHNTVIILFFINFQLSLGVTKPRLISYEAITINDLTQDVYISFVIEEKDFIYKDFITISAHESSITLSPWKSDHQPILYYDPLFKATKQIFAKNFTIIVTVTAKKNISSQSAHLYCSYYRNSDKKITQTLIPIFFDDSKQIVQPYNETDIKKTVNFHQQKIISTPTTAVNIFLRKGAFFIRTFIQEIKNNRYYFLLFLIIITLLTMLLYFFQHHLKNHKLKTCIKTISSLLALYLFIGQIIYLHIATNSLITVSYATCGALMTGLFCIKKSTALSTGIAHSLYTVFGIFSIIAGILLIFKTIQLWFP